MDITAAIVTLGVGLLSFAGGVISTWLATRSQRSVANEQVAEQSRQAVVDHYHKLVEDLRGEVDRLKSEVAALRQEVSELREENAVLRERLSCIQEGNRDRASAAV